MNGIIYLGINCLWAISIFLIAPSGFAKSESVIHILNISLILLIAIFQIFGAYKLYKGNFIIPIIATIFFVFSMDFEGFKFVTKTLFYVLMVITNDGVLLELQLDNPSFLLNTSFSNLMFKSLSINLFAIFQIALLYSQKLNLANEENNKNKLLGSAQEEKD